MPNPCLEFWKYVSAYVFVFLGRGPWPVVFCILTEQQHGSLSFNLCHSPVCWAPSRVQRSHLWGMCVEGGPSPGAPASHNMSVSKSLFFPLHLAVSAQYPRKCCIQGWWAWVTVRESGGMCECSVCLYKCALSMHVLLCCCRYFPPPPLLGIHAFCVHALVCMRASLCVHVWVLPYV